MAASPNHQAFLDQVTIAPEVSQLRPDYRALLIVIDGIVGGPSDADSEATLRDAEASASSELARRSVTDIEHVKAWRDTYKAFGAKPAKARSSLEALMRRVEGGLPRVNRLTDIYNAISVKYRIPLGGEDVQHYTSPPRLIRATGTENFELISKGDPVVEHPDKGEVVWCDSTSVTCRRWNWRQCNRTALTDKTTTALFILDILDPVTDETATNAGDELVSILRKNAPNLTATQRFISTRNI